MIAKSTRRKHRRTKVRLQNRAKVQLTLSDARVNFWLVSYPLSTHHSTHREAYGYKAAVKELRRIVQSIT